MISAATLTFVLATLTLSGCSDTSETVGSPDASLVYHYELVVDVDGEPTMDLAVEGQSLSKNTEGQLTFLYEAEFASHNDAQGTLSIQVKVDDAEVGILEARLDPCSGFVGCPTADLAQRTLCLFETGEAKGTCGQLDCYVGGEWCGGFIE